MRDQVSPLLDGSVDAAIVRLPVAHRDVVVAPVAQEPREVIVSAAHDLADERSVQVDDILRLPVLPLACRPDWSHFWPLNDERGGANDGITSPATMARLTPNPRVRFGPGVRDRLGELRPVRLRAFLAAEDQPVPRRPRRDADHVGGGRQQSPVRL
jgi:hypothetical protein